MVGDFNGWQLSFDYLMTQTRMATSTGLKLMAWKPEPNTVSITTSCPTTCACILHGIGH